MAEQCGSGITLLSERRAAEIAERRESLAHRLEDGYARIDQASAEGSDVTAWEEFWISLLHEYEMLCDELAEAA